MGTASKRERGKDLGSLVSFRISGLRYTAPMVRDADAGVLAPHRTLPEYYANPAVKREFLREIFDSTAAHYDQIERLLSLGSGRWYRGQALRRAGLGHGMRVLDVAVGTGLVAREEIAITGEARLVIGLDPSREMLRQAVRQLGIRAALGVAEQVPLESGEFEFVSMGYALRHLGDVRRAFAEFFRVLRPGGRVCVLEITTPRGWLSRRVLRSYMSWIVPALTRITTGSAASQRLWKYYWETIDACMPPERVIEALEEAGFEHARRSVALGIFSEFTAVKPNG